MRHRIVVLLMTIVVFLGLMMANHLDDSASSIEFSLPSLSQVTKITIDRTGQDQVILYVDSGGPIRVGTQRAVGDKVAAGLLREAFKEVLKMDHLVDATDQLDRYGISEHSITVSMYSADSSLAAFRLGKVVDGQRTFIEDLKSGTLYRARSDLRSVFDRPAFSWRERRLFPDHSYANIQSVEMLRSERTSWKVSRTGAAEPWKSTETPRIELGQREVDSVANTLASAQAVSVRSAEEFSATHTLRATTFDGDMLVLRLGAELDDGSIVVRTKGASTFVLPRHQKIFLRPTMDDLRNRRLFNCTAQEVRGISLAGPNSLRMEFDDGWFVVSPLPRTRISRQVSDSFLDALLSIRGMGFTTPDAFGKTAFSVTIRLSDERVETLEVGAKFGNGRHARITSKPNRVLVLPASAIELLRIGRDRLTLQQSQRER